MWERCGASASTTCLSTANKRHPRQILAEYARH